MTLTDLFLFWVGNADAIRQLAGNPWTLAVGAPWCWQPGWPGTATRTT